MGGLTARVALGDGGLRFRRVMAGAYRCDLPCGAVYTTWAATRLVARGRAWREEDGWRCEFHAGGERRHLDRNLGFFRTYTDAKVAANEHYMNHAAKYAAK